LKTGEHALTIHANAMRKEPFSLGESTFTALSRARRKSAKASSAGYEPRELSRKQLNP
jgi:hypothetical protein